MTSHLGIGTRIRVRLHTVLTKGFLILFLYWKSSFTSKAQGYFLKTHTSSRLWYHRFTEKNILRIYPNGTRINSSNYDPVNAWRLESWCSDGCIQHAGPGEAAACSISARRAGDLAGGRRTGLNTAAMLRQGRHAEVSRIRTRRGCGG
ncbi:uncharacterized protein [Lolium perenne]|uniref:uncharacterized protein isoform X1 n=1 Tax=Lolium perenne TaxID=4522 RepID=UPI0021F52974|nr:uncharacterized protein LOC127345645 [Lolium perenne]